MATRHQRVHRIGHRRVMRRRTLMFIPIAATLWGCGDKVVFPPVEAGLVDVASERSVDGQSSDTANSVPDASSEVSASGGDAALDVSPDAEGE